MSPTSRTLAIVVVAITIGAVVLAVVPGRPPFAGLDHAGTVTVHGADGHREGTITVAVADTPVERYQGLSDTQPLGPNEGMLFVFPDEGTRTFVMRGMAYPLDMIFVGADGRITAIHHAPVESGSRLTRYAGRAKWVIEVREGWTTDHGVAVGDTVSVAVPGVTGPGGGANNSAVAAG